MESSLKHGRILSPPPMPVDSGSPSNAVLLTKIQALSDVVLANQTLNHETNTNILSQVVKTNGRVTKLEAARNVLYGCLVAIPSVYAVISLFDQYVKK